MPCSPMEGVFAESNAMLITAENVKDVRVHGADDPVRNHRAATLVDFFELNLVYRSTPRTGVRGYCLRGSRSARGIEI
jgi:hypothetical protein